MRLVYIAGPFRGPTTWDIHRNVCRAEAAALEVARLGAMPLCPHKNTEHFQGQLSDVFWCAGTMEMLRRCDAMYVLPDSEASMGTQAEIDGARQRGIPVFLTFAELGDWLLEAR